MLIMGGIIMEGITPEEFAQRMQKLVDLYSEDEEILHSKLDELMMETLISLGYEKGVEIFDNAPKWYS